MNMKEAVTLGLKSECHSFLYGFTTIWLDIQAEKEDCISLQCAACFFHTNQESQPHLAVPYFFLRLVRNVTILPCISVFREIHHSPL